jgi:signal transduction histidine kinase
MVEQTLTEGASKEDCRDTAYRIIEESDRLSAMISTLLEITELNAGASVYRQSTVDLTRVVLDACELYQPLIEEQDISLICRTLSDPAPIRGDKPRMQRMVGNLMDNAAKFTDPGGVIEVDISRTQTRVVLRIANSGEGIDPKDQERIFDRFFRGDKSRTTSGTGLGLSVVKAIVEAYDGTIHVGSRPGAGTAFTISFPRLAEH